MLLVRLGALLLIAAACQPPRIVPNALAVSRQAIVVVADQPNATTGKLQRYERDSLQAPWRAAGDAVPVVFGRKGLAPAGQKREGDGRSPSGIFPLGTVFGFAQSIDLRMPYRQLRETTECVDDSASFYYNQIVDRDMVPVDWSSSEKMREIGQYHWGVVVEYNTPPKPQRGSCIFLHIWSGPNSTTAGCTAMRQEDLQTILLWLDPRANPLLVQGVEAGF
ncbi:MAG TPA: L,D-transpeptidase family protein [Thermoanaerobaculia bacterium]|nr:L,D-transpeptidase family protein [Thermoanaerobaculia bacterium]